MTTDPSDRLPPPTTAPAAPVTLRPALPADVDPLLTLLDDVVAWLVARGRAGQWGSGPMSGSPAFRAELAGWVTAGTLTVAVRSSAVVGAVALDGNRPAYVPATLVPADALWVHTLVTARTAAGRGAGRLLLDACRSRAATLGVPLALDHWSGSPELATLYTEAGFHELGAVTIPGRTTTWHGTVRLHP